MTMTKQFLQKMALGLSLVAGIGTASAEPILVLESGTFLLGARNVDVGGILYDVAFQDGTCVAIFTGCDQPADFTFQTADAAALASRALLDSVFVGLFDQNVFLIKGCEDQDDYCSAFTPWRLHPTNTNNVEGVIAQNNYYEISDLTYSTQFSRTATDTSTLPNVIWAVWCRQEQPFTLTYTASTGGTISGTTPQTVDCGSNGTQVTAVPDPNYHFVDWSDGVLTASRTDTNITTDLSITANFEIDTYTVTSSVGTGSGSISPLGDQQVAHGQTTQFTLTPDGGYQVASVGGTCGGLRNGSSYTTNAITGPCTAVVNFVLSQEEIFKDGFE